jgi:hypothetical protein
LNVSQYRQPFWKPKQTKVNIKGPNGNSHPTAHHARPDDPPLPAMAEVAIAAEEARLYALRFRLYKAENVINFGFGILTWLIGLRMILEFLGADPTRIVVKITYSLTTVFMLPFIGIAPGIPFGPFLIDVSGFIAILFYAMLTWMITKAMWLILYTSNTAAAMVESPRPKSNNKSSEFRIR